jgi:alpha-mannosidase
MSTVHIISHTHWDREWYQTFQDFRLRLVHLVDNLLAILDHDPDYLHYMLDGQTIVLEDYLQMRINNLPKLQQYIQENRILIGPWYILPDEFLVSPESTIRNLLIGKGICEFFGQRMMVGYIPDPFGHISQMPQILRGFHIDTACLWRGVPVNTPTCVWWESPDGSRVMLAHLYTSYGNGAHFPAQDLEVSIQQLNDAIAALEPYNPISQYLIMRGSDHLEPRPSIPTHIAGINDALSPEVHVLHSTLPAYLAAATAEINTRNLELMTIKGELRDPHKAHMLPAVLSSRMWIKQRNHASENLLERWVEPFSTWAELVTRGKNAFSDQPSYQVSPRIANPAPLIHQAWKLLITCHPHDSICGCSIDQVHEEMRPRFDQVDQIGTQLTRQSLDAITASINTQSNAPENSFSAINVFNAAPFSQSGLVSVDLDMPVNHPSFEICDDAGNAVPYNATDSQRHLIDENSYAITELQALLGQVAQEGYNERKLVSASITQEAGQLKIDADFSSVIEPDMENLGNAFTAILQAFAGRSPEERVKVSVFNVPSSHVTFLAEDVPAIGVRTFWVRSALTPVEIPAMPQHGLLSIENEYLHVALDRSKASLILTDKRNQVVYHDLNTFLDHGDRGDEYNFTPPEHDKTYVPKVIKVSSHAEGPLSTLIIDYEMELPESLAADRAYRSEKLVNCSLRSTLTLVKGVPRLGIRTEFDNQAADHRLEVHFPSGIVTDHALMDGHFDVVDRKIALPQTDATWAELPRPEVPQRTFCDVSTRDHGLMIANRGLPEVAVLSSGDGTAKVSLTLLRCVGWLSREDLWNRKGHAGPGLPTPGAQEIGIHTFEYSVIPHDGNWKVAARQAYAFNTPLDAVATSLHTGSLPAKGSLITCDSPDFVITAVKAAEKDDGWLVRGFNMSDDPIQVILQTGIPFTTASEVFLDESHKRTITPETDGTLKLAVGDHEILSIKFEHA